MGRVTLVLLDSNVRFGKSTYLKLRVTSEKQHVYYRQLVDVSMSLEILPDFRSQLRNWHVEGIHLLNLGSLPRNLIISIVWVG